MKTIAIIGSTGSIGTTALHVIQSNRKNFKLIYLVANKNISKLKSQYHKYKPQKICLLNSNNSIKNSKIFIKIDEILRRKNKIDYVISGLSSFEAIKINFDLTKISKNLLIANKESIICGGEIFLKFAKKNNCNIIPIDSEHHCLDFFFKNFKGKKKTIKEIYLVASGGPFVNKVAKYNESISAVIKHPTWKMGKKITVDSSTLANKVLELFEAKILFNIPTKKLKIVIEKKSNAHAIIKFHNNIILPLIHKPSMKIPIKNSLGLNNELDLKFDDLSLRFMLPDKKKFPLISLGYKILKQFGNTGMIYFTVLNERLVNLYLNGQINYGDITKTLVKVFSNKYIINKSKKNIKSVSNIMMAINNAKKSKL